MIRVEKCIKRTSYRAIIRIVRLYLVAVNDRTMRGDTRDTYVLRALLSSRMGEKPQDIFMPEITVWDFFIQGAQVWLKSV